MFFHYRVLLKENVSLYNPSNWKHDFNVNTITIDQSYYKKPALYYFLYEQKTLIYYCHYKKQIDFFAANN